MAEDKNLIERILVLVPGSTTVNTVRAQAHLCAHDNLAACQEVVAQFQAKEKMMHSLYQKIGRVVIHEIGGYLHSAIIASNAEADLAAAIGDEHIARSFGIEPMNLGEKVQFDLFLERVWALSTDPNYEKAHRAVKLIHAHVKDRQKFRVSGKMGGSYLDMDCLLNMFSPEHKPVRSGAIKFSDSAIHYSLNDHGFSFCDESMNVRGSSGIFNPIVLYFRMQSVMAPYAAQLLDSVSKDNITFRPDQLTHFSGEPVSEVVRRNQLFLEHPF